MYRRRFTSRGKTDQNDALALARATLQEENKLEPVLVETETEILNILMEHYDNLKGEKNRSINRLHDYESKQSEGKTSKEMFKTLYHQKNL